MKYKFRRKCNKPRGETKQPKRGCVGGEIKLGRILGLAIAQDGKESRRNRRLCVVVTYRASRGCPKRRGETAPRRRRAGPLSKPRVESVTRSSQPLQEPLNWFVLPYLIGMPDKGTSPRAFHQSFPYLFAKIFPPPPLDLCPFSIIIIIHLKSTWIFTYINLGENLYSLSIKLRI